MLHSSTLCNYGVVRLKNKKIRLNHVDIIKYCRLQSLHNSLQENNERYKLNKTTK